MRWRKEKREEQAQKKKEAENKIRLENSEKGDRDEK